MTLKLLEEGEKFEKDLDQITDLLTKVEYNYGESQLKRQFKQIKNSQ